jgi:hypothetical protein
VSFSIEPATIAFLQTFLPGVNALTAAYTSMQTRLDRIEADHQQLLKGQQMAQATMQDLLDQVARQKTTAAGLGVLLTTLFALRDDPVKLQAAFDGMKANTDSLAAMLVANTPGGPVVPPAAVPPAAAP